MDKPSTTLGGGKYEERRKVKKPTKAQLAEERRKETNRAVRAMDCDGCPYAACAGATATLSWDEMIARFQDEAGKSTRVDEEGSAS